MEADPLEPSPFGPWPSLLVTFGRVLRAGALPAERELRPEHRDCRSGRRRTAIARKLQLHPEYGIRVVGFIDPEPRDRREDIDDLALLGDPTTSGAIVRRYDVERVIFAFSHEPHERLSSSTLTPRDGRCRSISSHGLFEAVGPRVEASHGRGPAAPWAPARASRPVRPCVEARDRRRRRVARCCSRRRIRLSSRCGSSWTPPAGLLSPDAARAEQARVHDVQVPDDERRHRPSHPPRAVIALDVVERHRSERTGSTSSRRRGDHFIRLLAAEVEPR